MRWFCSKFRLENSRQLLITLLLLAGFFAALIPIPVSLVRSDPQKDRSEPFPCQDRPCACRSAAQCKKQCCCFTAEQKQAWGRRHGVKAFAGPLDKSASEPRNDSQPRPAVDRQACCVTLSATQTTSLKKEHVVPQKAEPLTRKASKPISRFKVVIGVFAQHCQGVSHTFAGVPIYIVPQRVVLVTVVAQKSERLTLEPILFEQGVVEPPVPPPRRIGESYLQAI